MISPLQLLASKAAQLDSTVPTRPKSFTEAVGPGSGPFNPNIPQSSGPFNPGLPGSAPVPAPGGTMSGQGAPPFFPDGPTSSGPFNPNLPGSAPVPGRLPWEIMRDRIFKQPWYQTGEIPQSIISNLPQQRIFQEALKNSPELQKLFAPYLNILGG